MKDLLFRVPADESWLAQVRGALTPLMYAANFEQFGDLTPDEMADTWRPIILEFFNEVQFMVPIGVVLEYAGHSCPDGFLWADGSLVSRTTYAALFAAIGVVHGAGDGVSNFALPDRRSRVAVGSDDSNPLFETPGAVGGEVNHTLTIAQLPIVTVIQNSHNHTQNSHNHTQNSHDHALFGNLLSAAGTARRQPIGASGSDNVVVGSATAVNQAATAVNQAATATNQAFGSGAAHNNLQPYIVQNFIIRVA